MRTISYRVTQDHISEYLDPITFSKGTSLSVGERYQGPENWKDWIFCNTSDQKGGWVPTQIIEMLTSQTGLALEDYTARELNVKKGDIVLGSQIMNGWVWCEDQNSVKSGWVPLENLHEL